MIPLSKGGLSNISNQQAACAACKLRNANRVDPDAAGCGLNLSVAEVARLAGDDMIQCAAIEGEAPAEREGERQAGRLVGGRCWRWSWCSRRLRRAKTSASRGR